MQYSVGPMGGRRHGLSGCRPHSTPAQGWCRDDPTCGASPIPTPPRPLHVLSSRGQTLHAHLQASCLLPALGAYTLNTDVSNDAESASTLNHRISCATAAQLHIIWRQPCVSIPGRACSACKSAGIDNLRTQKCARRTARCGWNPAGLSAEAGAATYYLLRQFCCTGYICASNHITGC